MLKSIVHFEELIKELSVSIPEDKKNPEAELTAEFLSETDFRSLVPGYIRNIAKALDVKIHEVTAYYKIDQLPDQLRGPMRKLLPRNTWVSESSLRRHCKGNVDNQAPVTGMKFERWVAMIPMQGIYVKYQNDKELKTFVVPYDVFISNATRANIAIGDGVTAEPFWVM